MAKKSNRQLREVATPYPRYQKRKDTSCSGKCDKTKAWEGKLMKDLKKLNKSQ